MKHMRFLAALSLLLVGLAGESWATSVARAGTGKVFLSMQEAIDLAFPDCKIEKRTLVARLEGKLAGWEYEATRLDVLTETAKAFVEVLAAQERLSLIEESVQIGEEVYALVNVTLCSESASSSRCMDSFVNRARAAADNCMPFCFASAPGTRVPAARAGVSPGWAWTASPVAAIKVFGAVCRPLPRGWEDESSPMS